MMSLLTSGDLISLNCLLCPSPNTHNSVHLYLCEDFLSCITHPLLSLALKTVLTLLEDLVFWHSAGPRTHLRMCARRHTHPHTHTRSSQPPMAAASAADRMFLEIHMNKCAVTDAFRLQPSSCRPSRFHHADTWSQDWSGFCFYPVFSSN